MGRIPEGNPLVEGQEGGYKSPQIRYLWPHHISLARMVACGASPAEMQLISGMSGGQISRILGSKLFQAEVERLRERLEDEAVRDVYTDLKRMSQRAVEVLDEDLHRPAETPQERNLRQKAAFDVLDRSGYGKKESPQLHTHQHVHLHKEVEGMETPELLNDVLELTR